MIRTCGNCKKFCPKVKYNTDRVPSYGGCNAQGQRVVFSHQNREFCTEWEGTRDETNA